MLSIIAATGFMMTTDAFRGVAWVQETHETAVSLTLGLVALHILGIIVASCVHGDNLIRAMFTGRKQAGSERLLIPVQERCCWRATSTSPTTALPPRRRDR